MKFFKGQLNLTTALCMCYNTRLLVLAFSNSTRRKSNSSVCTVVALGQQYSYTRSTWARRFKGDGAFSLMAKERSTHLPLWLCSTQPAVGRTVVPSTQPLAVDAFESRSLVLSCCTAVFIVAVASPTHRRGQVLYSTRVYSSIYSSINTCPI